jgi:glycosyltransferase involved in cell wall biosynthesis
MMARVNDFAELSGSGAGKPRVLFVSNLFPDSASTYLGLDNATLLHQLREFCDLRVICPRPSLNLKGWLGFSSRRLRPREIDEPFEPSFIEVPYVPLLGTPCNHLLMRMFLRRPLSRIIKRDKIDLVLCSWLYPDGCAVVPIARKFDIPIVLITQGTDTHHYIHYPLRRKFIIDAIKKSCAVITRSGALARLLESAGADAASIYPVHNGVDESIFYPRDRALSRDVLGLSGEEKVIVFVGNFLPVKNPEFLLEAFSSIDFDKRVLLTMIGKGPLKARLEKLSSKLGIADRVIFTGPLDASDVATWMGAADCLALCSHNEGLPNVVIEALASGLPVVSSNVGGISELLDREDRGFLVDRGDMKGYCDALMSVISRDQLGTVISQESSGFSWRECARKHARIIDYVMSVKENGASIPMAYPEDVCSLPEMIKK